MPSDRLQTRLLPRASARLISVPLLWWFFLVNPLLFLWRGAAEASGSVFYGGCVGELVSEAPSGDWSFRVPMEIGVPPSPRQPAGPPGGKVHSIEFDMPRPDVTAFTFSLPVYGAIILAAPGIRCAMRPPILGTVLLAILKIILPRFPSRPLGIGLPLPLGERRRLPFTGPEFYFQVLDLLLQPLVLRLQTIDLPLQFFDLFRLAARLQWLGLIHPLHDKRTPPVSPVKTYDDPLINYTRKLLREG